MWNPLLENDIKTQSPLTDRPGGLSIQVNRTYRKQICLLCPPDVEKTNRTAATASAFIMHIAQCPSCHSSRLFLLQSAEKCITLYHISHLLCEASVSLAQRDWAIVNINTIYSRYRVMSNLPCGKKSGNAVLTWQPIELTITLFLFYSAGSAEENAYFFKKKKKMNVITDLACNHRTNGRQSLEWFWW